MGSTLNEHPAMGGERTDRGDQRQVQIEARALGDPTRHRIFRHIAGSGDPVGVGELTELVGLNHNAVRQHLAVLTEAGLVDQQLEHRTRPGRPRLLYQVNPEASGSWGTEGPYELLAALLSEGIRTQTSPREVGRRAGRRRARRMSSGASTFEIIEKDMAAGGFRPTASPVSDGCDFLLARCPFAEVAAAEPATVCQIHLGLTEGIATAVDGDAVVRLVAKDPRQGGCRVTVRTVPHPMES